MGQYVTDISELTPEALECRELGHAWEKAYREWLRRNPKGKTVSEDRVLRCMRCKAERRIQYDINAEIGKFQPTGYRRTYYPPGYVMRGRRLTRAEVMYYNYLHQQAPKKRT